MQLPIGADRAAAVHHRCSIICGPLQTAVSFAIQRLGLYKFVSPTLVCNKDLFLNSTTITTCRNSSGSGIRLVLIIVVFRSTSYLL